MMEQYLGTLTGTGKRIGIVVADFNNLVTDRLLAGAVRELQKYGVQDDALTVVHVPGAMELPRAVQQVSDLAQVDGVIALGAVIRGETSHYDYVCQQTAAGIAEASLTGPVPVMFGVLTTDTLAQAVNRAGGKGGNKGAECATGVLQMIGLDDWLEQANTNN